MDQQLIDRIVDDALAQLRAQLDAGQLSPRLQIWDGDHTSPLPREVFSDPRLLAGIRQMGLDPTYVFEDIDADVANEVIGLIGRASEADMQRLRESPVQIPDGMQDSPYAVSMYAMRDNPEYRDAYVRLLSMGRQGVHLVDVDPRREPAFSNYNIFNSTPIDQEIARRMDAQASQPGQALVGMYGWLHYSKSEDIDERTGSNSVGVITLNFLNVVRRLYLENGHTDFPKVTYIADTGERIDTSTDVGRAQFLGISVQEYHQFQAREAQHSRLQLAYGDNDIGHGVNDIQLNPANDVTRGTGP